MTAPLSWMDHGACRGHDDPELWFADLRVAPEDALEATRVCRTCPVQEKCAEYAETHRIHGFPLAGIWGGVPETTRRRARRSHPPRAVA